MQARSKVENSYLFHIEGIRCHSCIGKIENIKTMEPAISHAHMYFGESILEIKTSKAIEPKSVLQLIDQMGFKGQYLQKESDNFELQKQQNRKLLSKVGVAGFIAGNIMLFSIPIYSGLEEGSYKISFSYISFFLFLPIVAYCAVDLYKNAYYSLKNKSLSIDLPISIALLSGFFLSVFNLLIGEYDYLYFDSTASFIFLILSSRYFLQRVQQNFVYSNRVNSVLEAKVYRVSRQGQQLNLNAKDILPGDTLDLEVNDIIPVDGVLANEISEIDTSFISGESLPQIFHQKMKVLSGSINLSPQTKVVSSTRYSSSQIQQIFEKVEEVKKTKGHYSQIADKAAHWLISIVFAVAAVFFVYYYFIDPMEAFQRALALLIVACPCALALGTPLAYALGVQRAKQKNILIKDQNILDKVLEIKNLFFDKTGTITRGQLELKTEEVEPSLKNVVLNLEKISNHPIAFAFRRAWPEDFRPLLVTNAQEKVGVGVEGNIDGVFYQLVQGSGEYGITVDLIADSKNFIALHFLTLYVRKPRP